MMQPAALLPGSSYDTAADEGEGLLASLGHSLSGVVQGWGWIRRGMSYHLS